jgi:hypothetical protein
MGKSVRLCEFEAGSLAHDLNILFKRTVNIPRISHGSRQTIDALINEEAYLFARLLRNQKKSWIPRIAKPRMMGRAARANRNQ